MQLRIYLRTYVKRRAFANSDAAYSASSNPSQRADHSTLHTYTPAKRYAYAPADDHPCAHAN